MDLEKTMAQWNASLADVAASIKKITDKAEASLAVRPVEDPATKIRYHAARAEIRAEEEYWRSLLNLADEDASVAWYRRSFYALAYGWLFDYSRVPLDVYAPAEIDAYMAHFDTVSHALHAYDAAGRWTKPFAWPRPAPAL